MILKALQLYISRLKWTWILIEVNNKLCVTLVWLDGRAIDAYNSFRPVIVLLLDVTIELPNVAYTISSLNTPIEPSCLSL